MKTDKVVRNSERTTPRRAFLLKVATVGTLMAGASVARSQGASLEESDPQAVALGYKRDTTQVDQAKFSKHDASQKCANCQLFQGKAGDAQGPCPLFAAKQVAAAGWCSAWVKKAG